MKVEVREAEVSDPVTPKPLPVKTKKLPRVPVSDLLWLAIPVN
ncbi:MAG: hypothetical protein WD627_03620 [Actinomycetota bacterium]